MIFTVRMYMQLLRGGGADYRGRERQADRHRDRQTDGGGGYWGERQT